MINKINDIVWVYTCPYYYYDKNTKDTYESSHKIINTYTIFDIYYDTRTRTLTFKHFRSFKIDDGSALNINQYNYPSYRVSVYGDNYKDEIYAYNNDYLVNKSNVLSVETTIPERLNQVYIWVLGADHASPITKFDSFLDKGISLNINDNGIMKISKNVYINNGGVAIEVKELSVNDNGILKKNK